MPCQAKGAAIGDIVNIKIHMTLKLEHIASAADLPRYRYMYYVVGHHAVYE